MAWLLVETMYTGDSRFNSALAERMSWPCLHGACLGHTLSLRSGMDWARVSKSAFFRGLVFGFKMSKSLLFCLVAPHFQGSGVQPMASTAAHRILRTHLIWA